MQTAITLQLSLFYCTEPTFLLFSDFYRLRNLLFNRHKSLHNININATKSVQQNMSNSRSIRCLTLYKRDCVVQWLQIRLGINGQKSDISSNTIRVTGATASLRRKFYPYCSVLVGSRNRFMCDLHTNKITGSSGYSVMAYRFY